jgi:hypothetical protein
LRADFDYVGIVARFHVGLDLHGLLLSGQSIRYCPELPGTPVVWECPDGIDGVTLAHQNRVKAVEA